LEAYEHKKKRNNRVGVPGRGWGREIRTRPGAIFLHKEATPSKEGKEGDRRRGGERRETTHLGEKERRKSGCFREKGRGSQPSC